MTVQRVITSPVRLTGSVHPQQLSTLVCIDAMIRRRAELGDDQVRWELSTLAGDAAVQRAVQRVVAREGDHPDELGREGFAARARQLEHEAEADLRRLLASLNLSPEIDRWGAHGDDAIRAARVAFVRLYEAGVVQLTDAVVDTCLSCETVTDVADTDIAEVEVDVLRLAVPLLEGTLEIDIAEPELLIGAVAVVVPSALRLTDNSVRLPLIDADVPLIVSDEVDVPTVVVPGHDRWSYDLARQLDLPLVEVLDGEGVVHHPGVLEGLGRYAARAAATEQLSAEGFVVAHFADTRSIKRCYRCGTALVPLFGSHWILSFRTLVEAAVDEIRAGAVEFSPATAMDDLLTLAEQAGSWVVSQQLWSGSRIPVATCMDCGQTQVSVDEADSCGSCMGTLEPHNDVLDARFVSAITPLAMIGWPTSMESPEEVSTTLFVGKSGLDIWALPIAALGLRLAGRIAFQQLVVHQSAVGVTEPGQQVTSELADTVEQSGVRVARASLLMGDLNFVRAGELVAELDEPPSGEHNLSAVIEAYDKAVLGLDAGQAMVILANAVRDGVVSGSDETLRALRAPLLGQ